MTGVPVLLSLLLACADDPATQGGTTTSAVGGLIWELHEIDCVDGNYTVPSPTSALAQYTVFEHILNSQGEGRVKPLIEQVNELSTDTDTWSRACEYDGGYLLVVTYAYPAE